jgi:ABC-2 type transport system ATP-binding protein
MIILETHHLTKKFGNITALDNLSLKISEGEIYGFVGPNGAGKTTTIKLLTGLLKPTSGRVFINGYDIQEAPLKAKAVIGYLPDIPYFYEKLTAGEFLEFIGDVYQVSLSEREARREELTELFELKEFLPELIEALSHGTRQRLALVSIFLHNPKVIIVDEPIVGLDPKYRRCLEDFFKRKASRDKATIFISSHTLPFIERLCTRVGIVNQGKLICEGTISSLRKQLKVAGGIEEVFFKSIE